jgi:neopullulanase
VSKSLFPNIIKTLVLFLVFSFSSYSQDFSINKIEPPNWWVGMEWDTLQLMVYGENLNDVNVKSNDKNLKILNVYNPENNSYLFVDIYISPELQPNDYQLKFEKNGEQTVYEYPILTREFSAESHLGFSNEDVIYLIFADRFCDGNPANNTIGDSLDEFTSADLDGRKGGDIEGMISKLDYLNELGVTAIWITPMLENNMWMSYHGYAATDLYKIDPRFGSNELYKKLVEEAHKRGMKVILDHVSNHIGINHYWMNNLPTQDWFNGSPSNHLPASHDKMAFLDVHGDSTVVKFSQTGWFTEYMPDLNQRNPFLKNYLIQNTIWWIELSGLDGIREDTYPYADQKYLSEWAEAILIEYPNFNIVGEVWQGTPGIISGYQTNSPVRIIDYDSNLPAVTDFALSDAIRTWLSGDKSIKIVYETLAQDFIYSDPDNLLVFFDNHDIDRAMLLANGNIDKIKLALNIILFTRGIPVIFYGTEIGIEGGTKHGQLRQSFTGGFENDQRNAFTEADRTKNENEIFNYLQTLLKLRKQYPALSQGKLTHIYSGDNIYYLIKTFEDERILLLLNTGDENIPIYPAVLGKIMKNASVVKNLLTDEEINLNEDVLIDLKSYSAEIYKVN